MTGSSFRIPHSAFRIGVVDYGMGNLHSVARALEAAGGQPSLVTDPSGLGEVDLVVLPGVGHFGEAMRRLGAMRMTDPLREYIRARRPFLGICLGFQILFDSGEEAPGIAGLGVYRGTVRRFPDRIDGRRLLVPSIGWNQVRPRGAGKDVFEPTRYYFVHSYFVDPEDRALIGGETEYGVTYASALADPPLFATQFHPEKSSGAGIGLLKRIIGWA